MQVGNIDVRDVRDQELNKLTYSQQREWFKKRYTKARVYFSFKGETVLDNLMNRKGRPYNALRREAMPEVLKQMGLPADTKVRWSQYAGCSCPCSPGFIVEDERAMGKTVWVEVS